MHAKKIFILIIALALTGCSWQKALDVKKVVNYVHPYRLDIQQGNDIDQSKLALLEKGMTQDQVRFLLGTPLIIDIFHSHRWDYTYYLKRGLDGEVQTSILSVYFDDNNRLDHVSGDVNAADSHQQLDEMQKIANQTDVIDLSDKDRPWVQKYWWWPWYKWQVQPDESLPKKKGHWWWPW